MRLKIGDVFSVKISESKKKFFHYVAKDSLQMNSAVIRVFKKSYPINLTPNLSELIKDDIDFYAHCFILVGLKMNLWKAEGNILNTDDFKIIFRNTNDYGSKPGEQIDVSKNWYIWKIGDSDFKRVTKIDGEILRSEIGIVINPMSIVYRMQHGKYDFIYPGIGE